MTPEGHERFLKHVAVAAYCVAMGYCYIDLLVGWRRLVGWVYAHETLATGAFALIGAVLLYWQIRLSDLQEAARRASRRRAVRVVSPIAVMRLSSYGDACASLVREMLSNFRRTGAIGIPGSLQVPEVPTEALSVIRDLCETLSAREAHFLALLVAEMQVHRSRLEAALVPSRTPIERDLHGYAIDTAKLSARVSALYDYVRWRTHSLPTSIAWQDVRTALFHAGFYEDEFPDIYRRLDEFSQGKYLSPVPDPWKSSPA